MQFLATAILSFGLSAGAASAAILTGSATFTGVTYDGDTSLFSAIGIDVATDPTPDMVFRWSLDSAAAPLLVPREVRTSDHDYGYVILSYVSFSVEIGDVTMEAAPSTSTDDRIVIRDGVEDKDSVIDEFFLVGSYSDQDLGSEVILDQLFFTGCDFKETVLDGLDYPTEEEFIRLFKFPGRENAVIVLKESGGTTGGPSSRGLSLNGSRDPISPVPLPASILLLGFALAGMGALARLRRRG